MSNDQSEPHKPSQFIRAHFPSNSLCDTLRSPLVTFLDVVTLISSGSFQWYRWCHHKSFDVTQGSFYYFFSLSFLYKLQKGEKREKKQYKRPLRHTETLIMTSPLLLEKSQWDESNDIKKAHQWWPECVTQAIRRQTSLDIFGQLVRAYSGHHPWPS
jgi:hypothetical protein